MAKSDSNVANIVGICLIAQSASHISMVKYLDANQDGYIEPEQFKRIILVCSNSSNEQATLLTLQRNLKGTSFPIVS